MLSNPKPFTVGLIIFISFICTTNMHLSLETLTAKREKRLQKWSCDIQMSMANASQWLSFGCQLISGAATDNSMLIKDMAWSDNYHCSLGSCLQEREITFATDVLQPFLRTCYLFTNMASSKGS